MCGGGGGGGGEEGAVSLFQHCITAQENSTRSSVSLNRSPENNLHVKCIKTQKPLWFSG